jgi:hypothetical protein
MFRTAILAALWACVTSTALAAEDFHFSIPSGWQTVAGENIDAHDVPPAVSQEAMSGKYVLYAVDPRGETQDTVGATFAVVEVPSIGRITHALLEEYSAGMKDQHPAGVHIFVEAPQLVTLGGVDVGMFTGLVARPDGALRMMQYVVPGRTHTAILTYLCPVGSFDRYRPVFESSAMATLGAYDHGRIWRTTFLMGGLFAATGGLLSLVKHRQRSKVPSRLGASATVNAPTTPGWECAACGRRAPARLSQCRCGAERSA